MRGRLDIVLRRRLESVERICDLSAAQRQKLELAGRGDIAGFLQQVAETRAWFAAVEDEDAAVVNGMLREAVRLNEILNIGPFYGESRFGKAAKRLLTNEQHIAFEVLHEIEQAGGQVSAFPRGEENLLRIRLTGTSFDDAGMVRLSGLTNVQQLALNGTRVTDAGLESIAKLKKLKTIYVAGTRVGEAEVAKLRDALPAVAIRK